MKGENIAGVVAGRASWGNVGTVVCDLDGVIYIEKTGIPGAGEALERITSAGIGLVFVTNNSTKTRQMVIDDIAGATGFEPQVASIVTSGMATASYASTRVKKALVLGGAGLERELELAGVTVVEEWRDAEAVVVGLDLRLSYDRLTAATLAIREGAEFVASNVDATYPGRDGLYPGGGAIAAALEAASGVAPVVCGKPFEPIRHLVRTMVQPAVVVVGDRPETDIALARHENWGSALVLSGVVTDVNEVPEQYRPDLVLDSISSLPAVLGIEA